MRNMFVIAEDIVEEVFIGRDKNYYGFYSGMSLLHKLNLTNQIPFTQTVTTNRILKRETEIEIFGVKFNLLKSRIRVKRRNIETLRLIDVVINRKFFDVEEEEAIRIIRHRFYNTVNLRQLRRYTKNYSPEVKNFLEKCGFPCHKYKTQKCINMHNHV